MPGPDPTWNWPSDAAAFAVLLGAVILVVSVAITLVLWWLVKRWQWQTGRVFPTTAQSLRVQSLLGRMQRCKKRICEAVSWSRPRRTRESTMERRDWTLLVLAAAGGKPLSPVQLQKTLFLLEKKLPDAIDPSQFYRFTPYHYGPFDSRVYDDARSLRDEGLAVVAPSVHGRWSEYAATPDAMEEAEGIKAQLSPRVSDFVDTLVDWVQALSFEELLRAVYAAYPEMKAKSVFRG
jgi:hypothetical protein